MNLAAPGYTLVVLVAGSLAIWLVNVRLLGVQLVVWHGANPQAMALRERRYGTSDSARDTLAITRALTIAGTLALLWILAAAALAPNLAHSPWRSSNSTGMHLDAPGYALVIAPFTAALVWFASRGDVGRAEPRLLRVMGGLALLWIAVSAVTAYA
jgi:hypothetical protein